MPSDLYDLSWIPARLAKAKNAHPLVPDAVSARLEELLEGKFSDRPLATGDIANAAAELLSGMAPAPPALEPDAKQ